MKQLFPIYFPTQVNDYTFFFISIARRETFLLSSKGPSKSILSIRI
jgi:hypothetical protein